MGEQMKFKLTVADGGLTSDSFNTEQYRKVVQKCLDDKILNKVDSNTKREKKNFFIYSTKKSAVFGIMYPINEQPPANTTHDEPDMVQELRRNEGEFRFFLADTDMSSLYRADLSLVVRKLNKKINRLGAGEYPDYIDIADSDVDVSKREPKYGVKNIPQIYNGVKNPPIVISDLSRITHFHRQVSAGLSHVNVLYKNITDIEKEKEKNNIEFNVLVDDSAEGRLGDVRDDELSYLENRKVKHWKNIPTSQDLQEFRIERALQSHDISDAQKEMQEKIKAAVEKEFSSTYKEHTNELEELLIKIISNPEKFRRSGFLSSDYRDPIEIAKDKTETKNNEYKKKIVENVTREVRENVRTTIDKKLEEKQKEIFEKIKTE